SVVDSVLLRPLPFPGAEQLVVPQTHDRVSGETWSVSYADFMDWRDQHVFDRVAVYQNTEADLTGTGEPMRVSAVAVSPQFFDALGLAPALGRPLQPGDFDPAAPRAVVLSDRLWRTKFGAQPDVVGRTVELNGIRRPIVGVLPAGARWPVDVDVWVPLRITDEADPDLQRRDNYVFSAIARLDPARGLEGTRAMMALLAQRAEAGHPDIRRGVTTLPTPLLEWALGPTTPRALWILLGAVGLLLLIACVNVASLQLARAAARRREIAVRSALGASRARLVAQTLAESGVLAAVGGAVGVLAAPWMVRLIVAVAPADVPRIETAAVSLPALAVALGASMLVALLSGLAPALSATRSQAGIALASATTRTTSGRGEARARRLLVAMELALSVVLLVGAGLAVRSIVHLRQADPGFETRHVLTASISLPASARYEQDAAVASFMMQLRDRLASAPGIAAAGIASASPLGGGGFYLGRSMIAEGLGPGPEGEVSVQWNVATPGYFAALGVPLLRGRDFTAHDDSAGTPVMIVNEAFARAMFPNDDPVGKRAMSSRDEKVYREIVGVVGNVKYYGASDSTRALVWVPYGQNPWGRGIVTVRTRGASATAALPAVRRELRALDPGIALANVMTMDEARARSMAGDRLVAILLGTFAALALTLAAVGVFGVLSYLVERRSRELGIRIALGAQRSHVVRVVARETVPMLAGGIAFGLLAAAALTRVVRSLLYEVQPGDPLTFAGVALVLGLVGVVAALVPVRRAVRADPVTVLRAE
ncbi:MAG TPA: ABC transporter permease, partial [Gemmatimonadaceae bacterium]|nr:ABC transporter permease [Gemmatimonadaceae bacterium]